ncbi:type II secretion system protein GspL [Escherichia coli]|nr:type II secretion system protein GspL [Escherichia coli]EGM5982344.1 type II secretion system protein GspL [Escherichia coli]MCB4696271.1 type II secretion system protein GspL [Escherichia coli]
MALFYYQALERNGRKTKGMIEADSARHARQLLRGKELIPVHIEARMNTSSGGMLQRRRHAHRRVAAADLALFTRQLATLVQAAMPLETCLQAVSEQSEKLHVKSLGMALRSRIQEGYTLSDSLREHPRVFDSLFCSMVAAGEKSGHLDVVLNRLADYTEQRQRLKSRLLQAMLYPLVLLVVATGVVTILLTAVVPKIIEQFDHLGHALPVSTRTLIAMSDALQASGVYWLAGLLGLLVLGQRLLKNPAMRLRWDKTLLRLPVIGRVARGLNTARFSRTLAVIHQQHMRNIAQWLQENGITRATVAPDWMSIPCGFMACDAQRVICRIDECRGWSAGLALAPVMFRAQLNEQDLPLSLTVVGIAPEKLSAWAGADAERLTVTALPAITTYGEPEGNLLTGPWQPRVSYRKQWARWRVMILPILLILVALAVERGVTLWSVSEQVAQSRTQAEEQFLTLFPEQKRIVNLRSQVTMALKKYRPQADDTRLLAELSAIASTLKSASLSDIEMRGFTFDQKRQILHLQLRAANFASFDKLRSALATDYVVQQDALQKEGDAVSGGVTLRRK